MTNSQLAILIGAIAVIAIVAGLGVTVGRDAYNAAYPDDPTKVAAYEWVRNHNEQLQPVVVP